MEDFYICYYPIRMQVTDDPKDLRAVNFYLYSDYLVIVDTTVAFPPSSRPPGILHFDKKDYPTHIDRLLELASNQRTIKDDERYIKLVSGVIRGFDT
jgi:hypothetical protein